MRRRLLWLTGILLPDLLWEVGLAFLAGIGLSVWSALNSEDGHLVALYGLGGFAISLFIVHRWRELRTQRKDKAPENEELRIQIRDWLDESGWAVQTDSQTVELFYFNVIHPLQNVPITVARLAGSPQYISIAGVVSFGSDMDEGIDKLFAEHGESTSAAMVLELMRHQVSYSIPDGPFRGLSLGMQLMCSRMPIRTDFFNHISQVAAAAIAVEQVLIIEASKSGITWPKNAAQAAETSSPETSAEERGQ